MCRNNGRGKSPESCQELQIASIANNDDGNGNGGSECQDDDDEKKL